MFFEHVYDESLAQASYVIGCQEAGVAIVIDPKRDVDTYLQIAEKNNLKITHVAETHIHADFLCGSRELAKVTGAELYLSDEGGKDWQYQFAHIGLKEGDEITVGNLSLEVWHTPGHTPESISFLLRDHPSTDEPVMMFTGDFVFVGDVGRPDLLEKSGGVKGSQEKGAKQLFASLQRFKKLPDHIQLWPGHGAGSACGKSLGAVPSTTVGYEKIRNWALQYSEDHETDFVKELLSGQPEPPAYFATMKIQNKQERRLLLEIPKHPKVTKTDFHNQQKNGTLVIDTRDKKVFEKGFIPNSINIQGNKSFAAWVGWFVDYEQPFILVTEEEGLEDLTRMLMRIGMDQMYGYIPSVDVYSGKLQGADVIGITAFEQLVVEADVQIVDIRSEEEYKRGHVPGAEHVFVGTLPNALDKISHQRTVVIHCQSGDRAAIGYSLLRLAGFENVKNYSAGMKEWKEEGKKVVQ